jgi:hypothetical protein
LLLYLEDNVSVAIPTEIDDSQTPIRPTNLELKDVLPMLACFGVL